MVARSVKPGYNAKVAIILVSIIVDILISSVGDYAPLAGAEWWIPCFSWVKTLILLFFRQFTYRIFYRNRYITTLYL